MLAGPRSSSYSYANNHATLQEKNVKYLEFKYLYFKIQKLINQKVILSLKYELLRTPEIHSQITKPLTITITEISALSTLAKKWNGSNNYNSGYGINGTISQNVVFILLLLRYEYIIQSENNLISFELLTTKANICEILAIRMLREYRSNNRINMLFVKPLGADKFNTLELSVLAKSKKFLSQPIITQIMDKIYNGEIIIKENQIGGDRSGDEEESLLSQNVANYRFQRISMNLIKIRSESVPKYQSLVINIKLIVFTVFYFLLILKHKHQIQDNRWLRFVEILFWLINLNINFETFIKLKLIRFKFLRKIIWTYIDLILIGLLDFVMLLRVYILLADGGSSSKGASEVFHNFFSIISIILLPRILSIFNNYEFFNMIILSFKRMLWKMIGLFCLFISLISGFYISFISLSLNLTSSSILFSMLKVFFGFTPSIWDNWDNYNTLGRFTQMGYLFLVQFVIATILAIVLSEVFHKITATNREEFHYFKATNIIIYQQTSRIFQKLNYVELKKNNSTNNNNGCSMIQLISKFIIITVHKFMDIFKFPIIIMIFLYEIVQSQLYKRENSRRGGVDMKHFTFLDRDKDYYGDSDMIIDDEIGVKSRKSSVIPELSSMNSPFFSSNNNNNNNNNNGPSNNIDSHNSNVGASTNHNMSGRKHSIFENTLVPVQSISTIGNFKSASTDSLFIDEMLHRRYGQQLEGIAGGVSVIDTMRTSSDIKRSRSRTYRDLRNENEIMQKLNQIENLFTEVVKDKELSPSRDINEVKPYRPATEDTFVFKSLDFQNVYKTSESKSFNEVDLVTSIESISDEEVGNNM